MMIVCRNRRLMHCFVVSAAIFVVGSSFASDPRPGPVPADLRTRLKLDDFYQKHLDVGGLPILGSAKVSDNALCEAAWIMRHMLASRDDILNAMASQNVRAVVMAKDEFTTDVPEHSRLRPKLFWDRRARGLGATPRAPIVCGAEENLLNFRRDPYPDENIFLHEFSHAIHLTGMNKVDPTFDARLKTAYSAAKDRGLWKNTYAATNHHEYWAEGVQSWFDDNAPPDALHNDVRTRDKLKDYDPGLAELCKDVFGDGTWRYLKPSRRDPKDRAHLLGYDPNDVPQFRWRETPATAHPHVVIQTTEGDFDVELDTASAPAAVTNFLRITLDGGFHSGRFARMSGGGVWATPSARWKEQYAKDLTLEKVPPSNVPPKDGTIALVQEESGWVGFAVFLGEKLDVGTGVGVPIGRITNRKSVVQKIIESPARDGRLIKVVEIRRVIRND